MMKLRIGRLKFSLLILLFLISVARAAEPVSIIFDTDMGGDCDDVGALFILHGAVEKNEVRLLATIGCTSSEFIAPCLDAVNTWFGRADIPVGSLKDSGVVPNSGFTAELARRYPHKFPTSKEYPDAIEIYRKILTKEPDGSVVIVAVGPLRNIANLLRSKPDSNSTLDGKALVARKVRRLDIMGGKYPPFASKNEKDGEYNFIKDPPSTALVCSDWPTPILFNGEGGSTCSGRRVTYEMPEHNPLSMAYRLYPGVGYAGDRLSWDPVSCLVSVKGAAPWFKVISSGVNVADATNGINSWKSGEERGHAYLVLDQKRPRSEIESALEDLMVQGKGRPTNLIFNTAYYATSGMCRITSQRESDASMSAIKAFDGDDKSAWLDKSATSWVQCQYVDGRKYAANSYVIVCKDKQRLPRVLELSGSNDDGVTWRRLDIQESPGFSEQVTRCEFTLSKPAKWNIYRLNVTAMNAAEGVQISAIELNEKIDCKPGTPVSSLTLDQSAISIPANGRATINATLAPIDSLEREVTWTNSSPEIAEVKRIGEQVAIVVGKKPGNCIITASIDNKTQTCLVTVTRTALPEGWSYDEIGTPPVPGGVTVVDGKFAVTGCGHAMSSWWERVKDQGVFVSKSCSGEVELTARLTSLAPNVGGPSYQWDNRPSTAAGLMIRESLDHARGRFLLIQVEGSGDLVCRWRSKSDDANDNQRKSLGKVTLPIHLKLTQSGKEIQVFTSSDGHNWGGARMTNAASFDEKSSIGLFVCSGNTFASSTAVFEAVNMNRK